MVPWRSISRQIGPSDIPDRASQATMGESVYPNATELLVTADCGGSNGYRVRLWKLDLQRLADETGLELSVLSFPARDENKYEKGRVVSDEELATVNIMPDTFHGERNTPSLPRTPS